jgi:hydrogenase nickel incorporation protein HypB
MSGEPRLLEVRKNVLKHNDFVAHALRERFRAQGTYVVSLVSSPGAGKTAFLEKTLTLLRPQYRVAALVGDLATENDAIRLSRSQAPVKQITTGTLCHLEAAMIEMLSIDGTLDSSIISSLRTSVIWCARHRMTWEKISASFSFRLLKVKISR